MLGYKEIDFIVERKNERIYLQGSYMLDSQKTIDRELAPLRAVEDAWQKLLFSLDEFQPSVFDGIRNIFILNFLMGKEL